MEHARYLKALKQALKARGILYSELAESLRMTESGVKKMLNAKDISLQRLSKICDIIEVPLAQLFAVAENQEIPLIQLTPKQESALIENHKLLTVYWLFAIEKQTIEKIHTSQGFSHLEVKRYLQRLVTLDLIKERQGTYTPKIKGKFRWPADSQLVKKLNFDWSQITLRKALKSEHPQNHRLTALKLTANSYHMLQSRMMEVMDEFVRLSEREALSIQSENLKDVTALVALIDEGFFSL